MAAGPAGARSVTLLHLRFDVHTQTTPGIAEACGEVRNYGSITNELHAMKRTLAKIK